MLLFDMSTVKYKRFEPTQYSRKTYEIRYY